MWTKYNLISAFFGLFVYCVHLAGLTIPNYSPNKKTWEEYNHEMVEWRGWTLIKISLAEILCLLYSALEFICIIKNKTKKPNTFVGFLYDFLMTAFFFFFAIASIFLQVKILLYIGCLKHITRSIAFCVQLTSAFVEHFYLSSNLWYEFLATCKWVAWTVIFFFFVVVSNKGLQWKQAGLREPWSKHVL